MSSANSIPPRCFCGGSLEPAPGPAGIAALRCASCGYLRTELTSPQSSRAGLHEGEHPSAYQGPQGRRFTAGIGRIRQWCADFRVGHSLVGEAAKGSRALDLGCGQGFYLNALRKRGYETFGVELSELTARRAASQGHVVRHSLPDYAERSFDAAVSIHVLEHIEPIAAVLAELSTRLKPGARVHVEVPNAASWQARLFGYRWLHREAGLHVHHFTAPALRALLENSGIRVDRTSTYSFEHGLTGWLQSLYNLVFPYNRFFRVVILNQPLRQKLRAWPELLLAPLAGALALAAFVAESLAGRGAVIRMEGVRAGARERRGQPREGARQGPGGAR